MQSPGLNIAVGGQGELIGSRVGENAHFDRAGCFDGTVGNSRFDELQVLDCFSERIAVFAINTRTGRGAHIQVDQSQAAVRHVFPVGAEGIPVAFPEGVAIVAGHKSAGIYGIGARAVGVEVDQPVALAAPFIPFGGEAGPVRRVPEAISA